MPDSKIILQGVVHSVPNDLESSLLNDDKLINLWNGLTTLARNEWLCWVEDAKKIETREKRIARCKADILKGKRRPCCWPGCKHR